MPTPGDPSAIRRDIADETQGSSQCDHDGVLAGEVPGEGEGVLPGLADYFPDVLGQGAYEAIAWRGAGAG